MLRAATLTPGPLPRVSARRSRELREYRRARPRFLREHPYCQVWLAERGIPEERAIRDRGFLRLGPGVSAIRVPRAETVHHRNKRRGMRLLDETEWMAVSWAAHRQIERNKAWARERGYLRPY